MKGANGKKERKRLEGKERSIRGCILARRSNALRALFLLDAYKFNFYPCVICAGVLRLVLTCRWSEARPTILISPQPDIIDGVAGRRICYRCN